MVRSIKSCSGCGLRFVSHGGRKNKKSDQCSRCSNIETIQIESPKQDPSIENLQSINGSSEVFAESVHSRLDDDADSCGSEGGDDFHCTPIIESQDCEDHQEEDIVEPLQDQNHDSFEKTHSTNGQHTKLEARSRTNPPFKNQPLPPIASEEAKEETTASTATSHTITKPSSSSDVCFICGADLSRLKRRIDHIKRCSKKHGITGRDVRLVTNENAPNILSPNSTTKSIPNKNTATPPTKDKIPSSWHGDAESLLKLTKQDQCQSIPGVHLSKPNETTKSVSSWAASGYNAKSGTFVAPSSTRNLNNVLMAGSRRLQVTARAAHKRGEIEKGGKPDAKRSRYSNWNCPMYKKITGTDFVVDGFHYAKESLTKNYFLTHFHSDHYGGIASAWNVGTIYCSLPTASLVSQQLGVDKKYIHPLPMNTPTVVESRGKAVTVTLLDANHCPGAVMFLFEVGKRTILHVGDFRWSRDAMLIQDPASPLHKIVSQTVALDELYLDTTYCNEKYHLPPQSDTIKATIETFEKELERCKKSNPPKKTLHLFGAYTIGKEKIYLSVAERYGLKVYVDKSRYKILSTLNLPEAYTKLLTTNREESDMWVVPMGHLNMKKMPEYFSIANSKPFAPAYDRIVGYRPTGWSLSRSGIISSRSSGKVTIHSVPYSEHSSFPELVDCLECLKPAKIIPTVSASKSNEQIKLLLQGLRNKQNAKKMFCKKMTLT